MTQFESAQQDATDKSTKTGKYGTVKRKQRNLLDRITPNGGIDILCYTDGYDSASLLYELLRTSEIG